MWRPNCIKLLRTKQLGIKLLRIKQLGIKLLRTRLLRIKLLGKQQTIRCQPNKSLCQTNNSLIIESEIKSLLAGIRIFFPNIASAETSVLAGAPDSSRGRYAPRNWDSSRGRDSPGNWDSPRGRDSPGNWDSPRNWDSPGS